MADTDDNATDVFVYTGIGVGAVVPSDAVRVRFDPSVLVVPDHAFSCRSKMETIELHDGLREIGRQAFYNCTALKEVHQSDGVDRIGPNAFFCCNFTKFRSPPLITTISIGMLEDCTGLFSMEFTESFIPVELRERSAGAFYCGMLPSHPTLWLMRMLSFTVWTLDIFLVGKRQLLMHYEIDLMAFQFTARCTTYHITLWIWKNFAI
jgi:hypothetical protein